MGGNGGEGAQSIDKIDYILQIEIQRLQSEKETVAEYGEFHLTIIRTVRSRIFTTIGTLATVLLAAAAFQNLQQNQYWLNWIYTVLVIDFVFAAIAYGYFVYHTTIANRAWLRLRNDYNTIIFSLYEQRIFLVNKSLNIEVNRKQISTLSLYIKVVLGVDRIKIYDALRSARKLLTSIPIVGKLWVSKSATIIILDESSQNRNELINSVYNSYKLNKDEFEKERNLLPDWPQLINYLDKRYKELNVK